MSDTLVVTGTPIYNPVPGLASNFGIVPSAPPIPGSVAMDGALYGAYSSGKACAEEIDLALKDVDKNPQKVKEWMIQCVFMDTANHLHNTSYFQFLKPDNYLRAIKWLDVLTLRTGFTTKKASVNLSGGPYSAIYALYHWMEGSGSGLQIDLSNVLFRSEVSRPDYVGRMVAGAIGSLTGNIGTHNIDTKLVIDTGNVDVSSGLFIGNFTVRLKGQATRLSSGKLTFTGEMRAFNDRYDMDQKLMGIRSPQAEKLVRIANKVVASLNMKPKDYDIKIKGSIPVNIK